MSNEENGILAQQVGRIGQLPMTKQLNPTNKE